MASPAVPRIDWRRQVESLQPYLAEHGGVVRVAVSDDSPSSTFSKLIRQLMADGHWTREWVCVQIDAHNPNTHYLDDIVAQLDHSLKLNNDLSTDRDKILVGSYIKAERVEISDVEVHYQEDDYERAQRSLERLDRVADAIEEQLQTGRICLLFLNSHTFDKRTLSRFRERLWDSRLEAMTEQGLLVIDVSDPAQDCGPDWPPDPDLLLELPARFDQGSRAEAHSDLVSIALEEGIADSVNTAEMFATTLIQSNDKIRDLYAGFAHMKATRGGSP